MKITSQLQIPPPPAMAVHNNLDHWTPLSTEWMKKGT